MENCLTMPRKGANLGVNSTSAILEALVDGSV